MAEIIPKIVVGKDYIREIKKYEKKNHMKSFSLSEDYFTSTDNVAIIRIPTSMIENINRLKFEESSKLEEAWGFFNNRFDKCVDLEDIDLGSLPNYLIKQELKSEVRESWRKLYRHECNNRVGDCSIAQGLALGRNYDYCGNCTSNSNRLFLKTSVGGNTTIDKKTSFENLSTINEENHKLGYFCLPSPRTFELILNLLGNIPVEVKVVPGVRNQYGKEQRVNRNYDSIKSDLEKSLEGKLNFVNPLFKITSSPDLEDRNGIEIIGYSTKY